MKPGATIRPAASKTSASFARVSFPAGATAVIFSPSRRMSSAASVLVAGSRTRPFLMRSMRWVLCVGRAPIAGLLPLFCIGARRAVDGRMCAFFGHSDNQQIEKSHAHSDAVGDLLKHAGLGTVSDLGRDLDAAIHRAGMENDGVGLGVAKAFGVELVEENVICGGEGRFVETLGLDAEGQDDIGAFKSFFDSKDAADGSGARTDFFELAGNPHGGAAKCEAAAEFSEEM